MRFKNFDLLRLMAASAVIFSHSFLIAEGNELNEPFKAMLGWPLGVYAVFTVFMLSGLLVTQSMLSLQSPGAFMRRRLMRVLPGLLVCHLVVISLAIHFFYPGDIWMFLSQNGWRTLLVFLSIIPDPTFGDLELYPSPTYLGLILNGALWTIQLEIVCYFVVAILFRLRMFNIYASLTLIYMSLCLQYLHIFDFYSFISSFLFVAPSFFAGSAMYFLLRIHVPSAVPALIAIAVLVVAAQFGLLDYAFPLGGAYLLAYLGTTAPLSLGHAGRIGDLSYGTYLYGWPVEQACRVFLGEGASWLVLLGMALPISLLLGFLSWHLVEKRALRLDPVALLRGFLTRGPAAPSRDAGLALAPAGPDGEIASLCRMETPPTG